MVDDIILILYTGDGLERLRNLNKATLTVGDGVKI